VTLSDTFGIFHLRVVTALEPLDYRTKRTPKKTYVFGYKDGLYRTK
jgi:hypothetical protein